MDPLALARLCWPNVYFYRSQREILYSVKDNDETVVVAGNQLGKDFVSGFICLWFFLSAIKAHRTCRIVTTSVKDDHLRVLWGEIGRFIQTSRMPLTDNLGGPIKVNHRDIRAQIGGKECPVSYLRGMVSKVGEGMAGHHAEMTLLLIDECSGVPDQAYDQGRTWAQRVLMIGNPNPTDNFFRRAVDGGDILAASESHI